MESMVIKLSVIFIMLDKFFYLYYSCFTYPSLAWTKIVHQFISLNFDQYFPKQLKLAVKERHCFARFVNFKGFNWNSAKTEKLFNKSYNSYI